jgi:hypothetical protein
MPSIPVPYFYGIYQCGDQHENGWKCAVMLTRTFIERTSLRMYSKSLIEFGFGACADLLSYLQVASTSGHRSWRTV